MDFQTAAIQELRRISEAADSAANKLQHAPKALPHVQVNIALHAIAELSLTEIVTLTTDGMPFWSRSLVVRGADGGDFRVALFSASPTGLVLPWESVDIHDEDTLIDPPAVSRVQGEAVRRMQGEVVFPSSHP